MAKHFEEDGTIRVQLSLDEATEMFADSKKDAAKLPEMRNMLRSLADNSIRVRKLNAKIVRGRLQEEYAAKALMTHPEAGTDPDKVAAEVIYLTIELMVNLGNEEFLALSTKHGVDKYFDKSSEAAYENVDGKLIPRE